MQATPGDYGSSGGSSGVIPPPLQTLFPQAGVDTATPDTSQGAPEGTSGVQVVVNIASLASPIGFATNLLMGGFSNAARDAVADAMKQANPDIISHAGSVWSQVHTQLMNWLTEYDAAIKPIGSWSGDDSKQAKGVMNAVRDTLAQQVNNSNMFATQLPNMATNLASVKSAWGHDFNTGEDIVNAVGGGENDHASEDYNNMLQSFGKNMGYMPQKVQSQTPGSSGYSGQTPITPTGTGGVGGSPGLGGGAGAAHGVNPNKAGITNPDGTDTNGFTPVDPTIPTEPTNPPSSGLPTIPTHPGGPGSGLPGPGGYSPPGGITGGAGLGDGTSLAGLADGAGGFGSGAGAGGLSSGAGAGGLTSGSGAGGVGAAGLGNGAGVGGAGAAGRGGILSPPMRGGAGGSGDDDERERSTWLTEDDDVWGGTDAPPGVIDN